MLEGMVKSTVPTVTFSKFIVLLGVILVTDVFWDSSSLFGVWAERRTVT